jgi:thymidylate kinase
MCILHGYEEYPEYVGSDVDAICDNPTQLPRVFSEREGPALVQVMQHETTAFYYVLHKSCGKYHVFLSLDVSRDYRRDGRVFFRGEEFLERCKPFKFFRVPPPELEFAYLSVKRVAKGSLNDAQARRLSHLYAQNQRRCELQLLRFFPPEDAKLIVKAARSRGWGPVFERMSSLRRDMMDKVRRERPLQVLRYKLGESRRLIKRILYPTGLMVAFLGADGSGKSTVIDRVGQDLAPVFRRRATYHLRPYLRKQKGKGLTITDPHLRPLRGRALSLAKLASWWVSYTVGYAIDLFPQLARSTLILFDRYYLDVLVDARRYRFGGSQWLAKLVWRVVPRPQVVILLDAPPEVLHTRKQEVLFEEIGRQREEYLKLVRGLPNGYVVDASKPLEEVVFDVETLLLDYLTERTARRLGVGGQG